VIQGHQNIRPVRLIFQKLERRTAPHANPQNFPAPRYRAPTRVVPRGSTHRETRRCTRIGAGAPARRSPTLTRNPPGSARTVATAPSGPPPPRPARTETASQGRLPGLRSPHPTGDDRRRPGESTGLSRSRSGFTIPSSSPGINTRSRIQHQEQHTRSRHHPFHATDESPLLVMKGKLNPAGNLIKVNKISYPDCSHGRYCRGKRFRKDPLS
jgi:hypothetical protein